MTRESQESVGEGKAPGPQPRSPSLREALTEIKKEIGVALSTGDDEVVGWVRDRLLAAEALATAALTPTKEGEQDGAYSNESGVHPGDPPNVSQYPGLREAVEQERDRLLAAAEKAHHDESTDTRKSGMRAAFLNAADSLDRIISKHTEPGACSCGSEGPDAFGNYDQIEDPNCPVHGAESTGEREPNEPDDDRSPGLLPWHGGKDEI